MTKLRYVVVDVFTDTPLTGNQLAVFTDARSLDAAEMQDLAREMNLSESVFVLPPEASDADVWIRIFTPRSELPFAGHPVLGSAFVLGAPLQKLIIRLQTGAGVVPVSLEREGARVSFGWMEQPIPTWSPFTAAPELLAALGLDASTLPVEFYSLGPGFVLVGLDSADVLAELAPDLAAVARLGAVGIDCFAPLESGWKSRVFVPAFGVPEDPATGSAAGPLAVHLARHGRIEFGQEIEINQGAELGRPSRLYARVEGAGDQIDQLVVGGSAVVVARGEFRIP